MSDKLFLHGKPIEGFEEVHEHISPVSAYMKVFGALLVLTALTYAVSYMNLGSASLAVAMIVAVIKATLVCMYFMHLKYDERYHVFVFLSTILFVGIFFTFTLFDLNSRDKINEEQDSFFQREYAPEAGVQVPVYEVSEHGEGAEHGEGGEHAEGGEAKAEH